MQRGMGAYSIAFKFWLHPLKLFLTIETEQKTDCRAHLLLCSHMCLFGQTDNGNAQVLVSISLMKKDKNWSIFLKSSITLKKN